VLAWISVMWTKPMSAIPFKVRSDTAPSSEAKEVSVRIPPPNVVPGTVIQEEITYTCNTTRGDNSYKCQSESLPLVPSTVIKQEKITHTC
jgi:hypothetical protein